MSNQVLIVPADRPFAERIARGHYTETSAGLTEERFPITLDQVGEWEWETFCFNRTVSSKEAVKRIREKDFWPAQIGQLLAFVEVCLENEWQSSVVALGSSTWFYQLCFPSVTWWPHRGEHYLNLEPARFINGKWATVTWWSSGNHFLGVRRSGGSMRKARLKNTTSLKKARRNEFLTF